MLAIQCSRSKLFISLLFGANSYLGGQRQDVAQESADAFHQSESSGSNYII